MTRGASRVVVLAAAVVMAASGRAPAQMTVSFTDALTYYALGEHDAVVRGLRASIGGDPDRLLPMLTRDADAWIAAGGADEVRRRRFIAATFALELALVGVDTQWKVSRDATEWACAVLRESGPPNEAERMWQLAALALIEGTFEPPPRMSRPEALALDEHIQHVRDRFPDEPRLLLAEALHKEAELWARHITGTGDLWRHDDALAEPAIRALEPAAAQPATRAEARLRIGVLEQHRGRHDAALPHLAAAAEGDDDPTRTYLAHLVSGWAHEAAGRPDEARAEYRRALRAVGALSAALGLGVQLYADDARDEADALVAGALSTGVSDPWKQYGYGDFRRLPQLLARLREMIR